MMNTIVNPYVGPQPFKENERDRFFGRKREARDLLALVISEQLVLFYAQSGAGKSSLINTCLIPDLRAKGFEVFTGRVVGDVPADVDIENIYVFNLLRSLAPRQTPLDSPGPSTITGFFGELRKKADSAASPEKEESKRHALIIDQFEEIFSTHHEAWEKREGFFQQLAQAMEDDPFLWVVLVMREDFIASLDPYAYLVPGRFRRRYYMQRLERNAALEAVKKPVENLRPYAEGVAEKLVSDLCSVKVYKPDGTPDVQPGQYVEPVQLQVICYNLWKNLAPGGTQITEKDVQEVGDVNASLGNYYADRVRAVAEAKNVSERKIREWFTTKLISPGGIRTMVLQEHGLKSSGLENEVIQALSDLIRAEQRGGSSFYELTHDRLVEPIMANNKKWEEEHYSALQRQAAIWKDQNENESWLLSDQALTEVEDWAKANPDELSEAELEFLAACRRLQAQIDERNQAQARQLETEKRSAQIARRITAVALGFLILAILTTLYAFSQSNEAEAKRKEADAAKSIAVTAQAEAKHQADIARAGELSALALGLADSKLDLGILLGIEANSLVSNSQSQNALLTLMQQSSGYLGTLGQPGIQDVQFSPDGKTFASLNADGITLWDSDTLQPLHETPLGEHFSGVSALALSQDGRILASGGSNGTIVVWDASTREMLVKPFKAQDGEISNLAISADGSMLAWSTSENTIIRWDIEDGRQIDPPLTGHTDWITSLAFSPDGKTLASGSYDRTIILWDPITGERQGDPIEGYNDWVTDLAFDGNVLASVSDDYRIVLWDVSKPADPVQLGEGSNDTFVFVRSIAVSPQKDLAASGQADGLITLWDISDVRDPVMIGSPFNQDAGGEISNLAFNPEGTLLTARSYDGSISLWNVRDPLSPRKIYTFPLENVGSASSLVFQPTGEVLVVGSYDSTIRYWDVSEPEAPALVGKPLQGHPGQPTGMGYSLDGSILASYGDDGTILFEVESQKLLGDGQLSESPTGETWAYQILDNESGKNTIYLKDAATGDAIGAPLAGEAPVFSPDGELLIFQTNDQETDRSRLHVWDITGARDLEGNIKGSYLTFNPASQTLVYQTQAGEEGGTASIVFRDIAAATDVKTIPISAVDNFTAANEDGTVLMLVEPDAASGRRVLKLFNTATGDPLIEPIEGVDYGVLSANGQVLLYYGSDENGNPSVNMLNVKLKEPIGEASSGYIQSLAWSSQFIAYSAYDYQAGKSSIHVIDTKSAQEITRLNGSVLNLVQDGDILIYDDNGIHLFDTRTQTEIGEVLNRAYVNISPNGKTLVTRGENDTVALWDTTNTWLLGRPIAQTSAEVLSAALSPDGNLLAFADQDGITLQDTAGNHVHTFPSEHFAGVSYVVLSSDQQKMLSIGEEGSTIAWDLASGEALSEPVAGSSVAFSADGSLFAVGDGDNITVVNTTTGTQQIMEDAPAGRPAFFSPDDRILAIEAETGTILFDLMRHEIVGEPIQGSIQASPQQSDLFIVVDQTMNTTTVWDWETQAPVAEPMPGSSAYVTGTGIDVLVVQDQASEKPTTSLWNLSTQKQIGETLTGIYDPSLSPDGTLISAADEESQTTYIWNLAIEDLVGSKQGYFAPILCRDNETAAFIGDEYVTLVDKIGEKPVEQTIPGTNLIFSPDCSKAVVIDPSGLARLWDVTDSRYLVDLGEADNAAFSSDGSKLAIGNSESNVTTFWNVNEEKPFGEEVPAGTIYFTPGHSDVLQVYDGFTDATTLWDVKTGTRIGGETYSWQYSPIFSAEGKLIAYNNRGIALWDISGTSIVSQPLRGHLAPVTDLLFSPDGSTLASLASDGIVLTDLDSGSARRLEQEDSAVQLTKMAFESDTGLTALGSDGTILTWDISATPVALLDTLDTPYKDVIGNVYVSALSPDGKYLVYEYNGKLSIWDIDQEKQIQETDISSPPVNAIVMSPDGQLLFFNDGSKIFQWEDWSSAATGSKPVELFSAGQNTVSSLNVILGADTPQYLVVGSYSSLDQFGNPVDPSAQIWELSRDSRLGNPLSAYRQTVGPYTKRDLLLYIDEHGRLIESNLDPFYLAGLLCNKAGRNFTYEEWKQYFPPEQTYRRTCGRWPLEPETMGSQAP